MTIDGVTAVGAAGQTSALVIETHCATIFFSAERVYTVKKPLDLGFVDFRSAASRQRACHRELEFNLQFAPDVYLGVDVIGPEGGEPVEWALVMRRLPSERRLSSLIAPGADVADSVRDVAKQLAVHHGRADRSSRIDKAATADQLRRILTFKDPFGIVLELIKYRPQTAA